MHTARPLESHVPGLPPKPGAPLHSPNHSNNKAIHVYARDSVCSEHAEQPASDYRTHDSQHDVQEYPFASFVDELAAHEASDQTQHNPGQNRHNPSP
jgi:hypothetical protein